MSRTLLILAAAMYLTAPAYAQTSRCADCHIANSGDPRLSAFASSHLDAWDHSAHGRNIVGCEKCHGGEPTTFERFPAHAGMLHSRNPASPVNRANVPRTCSQCHTGPFVAFQKSRHYELLRSGDDRGPSCTTCHGEVAARLMSPSAIAARCDRCHDASGSHPQPEYGRNASLLLGEVRAIRDALDDAESLIKRIKDRGEREQFEAEWRQAEVPLIEARQAGHEFVFDNMSERLTLARQRAESLMERLANRGTVQ
jgi:hypothetical protein